MKQLSQYLACNKIFSDVHSLKWIEQNREKEKTMFFVFNQYVIFLLKLSVRKKLKLLLAKKQKIKTQIEEKSCHHCN